METQIMALTSAKKKQMKTEIVAPSMDNERILTSWTPDEGHLTSKKI
jgi:hypothetical protein